MKKQTENGKSVSDVGCRVARGRVLFTAFLLAAGMMMAGTAYGTPELLATGGDTTNVIGPIGGKYYGVHSFTTVGSSATFTPSQDMTVEYLVVGGGGGGRVVGGGWGRGGGGAGGLISSVVGEYSGGGTAGVGSAPNPPANLTAGTPYPVTVGAGGGGGANGSNSVFGTFATAYGGGYGGGASLAGGSGGSGGGGGYGAGGGAGTVGQGWAGGPSDGDVGSGGGGAGNVGAAQVGGVGGNGGPGLQSSITGSSMWYAGGGGGYSGGGAAGTGGSGVGGNGGSPGTNGRGGGGGGNAAGGSGIVIVRYEIPSDIPPLLENVAVTNVTATGAELKGHLTTNGTYTATVGVLWGENTNAWANTNWWSEAWADDSVKSTNITFNPSDLNKSLYFTFIATSPAGATVVSPPMSFISGEVTVQSTGPAKHPATPGLFTISRPKGCTNIALTVTYTMGGTAVNGTDYILLSGSVVMAAGESNKVVTVTPLLDLDDPEAVTLTLGAGSGNYFYGSPANNASLTIQKADPPTPPYLAWGGDSNFTITVSGRPYAVHMYTNVGTGYFVPSKPIKNVEYLVIGGGGGGGSQMWYGGGGGAGGYRNSVAGELSGGNSSAESPTNLTVAAVEVIVGQGGAGSGSTKGTKGDPSSFGSVVSLGGAGGGGTGAGPDTGCGSGGGGGYGPGGSGGSTGTSGQGRDGGPAYDGTPPGDSYGFGGGGGGGASSNGNGLVAFAKGNGGDGLASSITGASVPRAGGGKGGAGSAAGSGASNAGGGGDGSNGTGTAGKNGIVIVRYDITAPKGTLILLR